MQFIKIITITTTALTSSSSAIQHCGFVASPTQQRNNNNVYYERTIQIKQTTSLFSTNENIVLKQKKIYESPNITESIASSEQHKQVDNDYESKEKENKEIKKEFTSSVGRSLPNWAKSINIFMKMPMITYADPKHIHAFAGVSWFASAYSIFLFSLFSELTNNDWTTFSSFFDTPLLSFACASAMVMGVTSSEMRPTRKAFKNYARTMRNGMVMTPVLALISAFLAISSGDTSSLPFEQMTLATDILVVAAFAIATVDLVVEGQPLDIESIIKELKIEQPPKVINLLAQTFTAIWLGLSFTTGAYVLQNTGSDMDAFVSQLAFSLALAPAGSSFAATLMQRDRFTKKSGQHVFVTEQPDGKFTNSMWLDAAQLTLVTPSPFLATLGAAASTGHRDWIQELFTSLVPTL
mmetsp:Transcript_44686/g.50096  ORF Transcript_44686/g.50096 Transcript_44686/m.50096 type:complete len:409 (-) Transcript_44686:30-1256(-)